MKKGKKKMIIKILCVIIFLGVIGTLTVVGINLYVTGSVKSRIVTVEKCKNLDADCIIVLGAGIDFRRQNYCGRPIIQKWCRIKNHYVRRPWQSQP